MLMMNHLRSCFLIALLVSSLSGIAIPAIAYSGSEEKSADHVARELANPNTPLATLTLRNQWMHWDGNLAGADGLNSGNIQFQPSFPFPVGERKNIFFRPSLSYLVNQPVVDVDTGRVKARSGFADIGYDLAYGYATKSGWNFLGGVVGSFPTGNNDLSSDTWTLGPEVALAKISKWGVVGIFPNHAWDVSGPSDISITTIQPFLLFFMGGGWVAGTSGTTEYNWKEEQWTVPIKLLVSKTVGLGRVPWKFGLEVEYNLERSDRLGQNWMIGLNISPVVPNIFARWLEGK